MPPTVGIMMRNKQAVQPAPLIGGIDDIDDLALDLDASAEGSLWQDEAATTPAGDGDPVALWQDQAGDHDAAQSTSGDRPTLDVDGLNGKPALRFNGSGFLAMATHPWVGDADRDIFIVYIHEDGSTVFRPSPFGLGEFDAAGNAFAINSEQDGYAVRVSSGSRVFDDARIGDVAEILHVRMAGDEVADVALWRNGYKLSPDSTSNQTIDTLQGALVGQYESGSQEFEGYVARVLGYAREGGLSDAERQAVLRELEGRYAVGLFEARGTHSDITDGRWIVERDGYLFQAVGRFDGSDGGLAIWKLVDGLWEFQSHNTFSGAIEFGNGLEISGDTLAIAGRDNGSLTLVDISDPDSPSLLGSYSNSDMIGAKIARFHGGRVYVPVGELPASNWGLAVFDVDDPADITRLAFVEPDDGTGNEKSLRDVLFVGDYAYCTQYRWDGIFIFDVSDPDDPEYVDNFQHSDLDRTRHMALSGDTLFVSSSDTDAVMAIDISDRENPAKISTLTDATNLDFARGLGMIGNRIYVAARDGDRVVKIDVSDPSDMEIVKVYRSNSLRGAYGLTAKNGKVYVTGTVDGDVASLKG